MAAAAASVYFETLIPYIFPASLMLVVWVSTDYRKLFYGIFTVLPFSMEFYFEGPGIGTDLPSEPAMILLSLIAVFVLIRRNFSMEVFYWKHPVFLILAIHVGWLFLTVINSQNLLISAKFFMAKMWYILPFFILPVLIFKHQNDFEKVYRILYKFLFCAILIVLIRHAQEDFSFISSYDVVRPFFRNHVSYAAICVVCLPFVWAFLVNAARGSSEKIMLSLVLTVFLTGIYFSYTRAAIIAIFIAIGAYVILQKKWVVHALVLTALCFVSGIAFLTYNNKYLDFTPEFEKTISHTEFDNLIEATYKLEDISTMERVYRWMAGVEMIADKPLMGFGPGTFYSHYKSYSISRFQTYVSDNPDQSGIHNYFLMTFVEQGVFGFLIFLAFCIILLITAEKVYHQTQNRGDKNMIMAIYLSYIIILAMLLINDLIETDKVGPFFFVNAAALLFYHKRCSYPTADR
jgi:O-antigen ligase